MSQQEPVGVLLWAQGKEEESSTGKNENKEETFFYLIKDKARNSS